MNQSSHQVVHQETKQQSFLRTWVSPTVLLAVIGMFAAGVYGVAVIRGSIDTLSSKVSAIDEAARAEMGRITNRIDRLVTDSANDMREVREEQRALSARISEALNRIGISESVGQGLRNDVNRLLMLERMTYEPTPGGPR